MAFSLTTRIPKVVSIPVLLAALIVSGWLGWRRATKVPVPHQRTGADFVVRWTCDQGHAFEERGAAGAKICPVCGGECYPTFTCICTNPECGYVQQMQLRYNEKVESEAMRWRPDGEWRPYVFPPKCPKCGHDMRPG